MVHKRRSLLLSAVCVVSALLGLVVIGDAQNAGKKSTPAAKETAKRPLSRQAIIHLLNKPIDTASFKAPQLKFRDFLGLLDDILSKEGIELPMLVDFRAFKEDDPNAYPNGEEDLYRLEISIPQHVRRLPMATLLRIALSRFPNNYVNNNATWIVRNGMIEFTTTSNASPAALMDASFEAAFDQRPLLSAIRELSDRTGVTILLDPKVGNKSETTVTATFSNGVPLRTAVSLLAVMSGLEMVEVPGALFVTSPENAAEMLRDRKAQQEQNLWRRDNNLPDINPPPQRPGADAGA
jgi:hypothetical protein